MLGILHIACFLQVDSLLSRLLTVKGRTDATEELLLLELAHRRNEIVSFTLVRPAFPDPCDCAPAHCVHAAPTYCPGTEPARALRVKVVTLVTMCISFVGATGSLFGQNL